MCRSMFCAIPCFWRVWDEEARDKMLLFLPVVGLETGAIWALLAWLCRYLALPALVQGAVLGAYPTSQYAAQKKPKSHIIVLCAQLAVYLAAGFLAGWRTGAALCGCLAGYALALRKAFRSLDGMNGDISGYALTLSELCGAAVWALI